MHRKASCFLAILILAASAMPAQRLAPKQGKTVEAPAAAKITSPKEFFGFNIGDDYQLTTYTQFEAYWKKLSKESPRMKLVDIGKTEEGRTQWMAIVSSPENMKNLDHYKEISRKLALAEGLTEEQAHALAKEGKAVVWIDGGIHATEVLGAHQLIEMEYQMLSRNDEETMRFQSRWTRIGQQLVHARQGSAEAFDAGSSAPVRQVRWTR
jgi:hypothetical protein